MIFTDVVEAIKGFSIEEKLQIQLLLQQYLREERREEIYQNLQAAKREEENGELTFSENAEIKKVRPAIAVIDVLSNGKSEFENQ